MASLHCFTVWFFVTTAYLFVLFYTTALLQVSNSLNDTVDTCSYIASGANPMFQPSHRVVGHTHSIYGCADGLSRFWSLSHSHNVFLLLSLGLCCFMQHGWVSSGWQLAAMVYLCRQEQSQGTRLTVFIHASLGNTPCHSTWKYKLKREFILGKHPLLPPEGLWLVKPLGRHMKHTCYSSCTSLNKLQEDVRKGRVCMGKERRRKLDEAEFNE